MVYLVAWIYIGAYVLLNLLLAILLDGFNNFDDSNEEMLNYDDINLHHKDNTLAVVLPFKEF